MLLPPFWRGRGKHVPAGNRLTRLRGVVKAALAVKTYRERLAAANLGAPALVDSAQDPEGAIQAIEPISFSQYCSLFSSRRPSWKHRPEGSETRSALLLPYAQARLGMENCQNEPKMAVDLYSASGTASATADLYRLARSLAPDTQVEWRMDHALVVFSGMDAGVLSETHRDHLWRQYQVPLFEQFVGTDGQVIAWECEVHAGLHVRPESAILECVDGELLVTSLTDEQFPAIRVRTGIFGWIDPEPCECGRTEPRIGQLRSGAPSKVTAAVA